MKRKFAICLAALMAVTVNAQAVDYSIKSSTGGIVISGNTDHVGDFVNVTVWAGNQSSDRIPRS